MAFGKGLLGPEGGFPVQQGQTSTRDLMGPKTGHGSGGCAQRLSATRSSTAS